MVKNILDRIPKNIRVSKVWCNLAEERSMKIMFIHRYILFYVKLTLVRRIITAYKFCH